MDTTFNDIVVENDTIGMFPKDYVSGHNVLFNETDVREFHWVVNGK